MFTAIMKTGKIFEATTMAALKKSIADHYEEDGSCETIKDLSMTDDGLEMEFNASTIGKIMEDIDSMIEEALDEIPDTTDFQEHNTYWGL